VLILLMQFSLRETIPLSTVVCLGVGAGNVVQMALKRHPFADRPLIDAWTAGLIGPMMLIGTILGVLLNQMVPNWFVLTLLVIVMTAATLRTLRRGINMWKEETDRTDTIASEAELANYQGVVNAPGFDSARHDDNMPPKLSRATSSKRQERLGRINKAKKQQLEKQKEAMNKYDRIALEYVQDGEKTTQWRVVVATILSLVLVGVTSFLKGNGLAVSSAGIVPCSGYFWLLLLCPIIVLPFIWLFVARRLMFKHQQKIGVPGYQLQTGDVAWTLRTTLLVGVGATAIGLITSLLGVGGGVLTVPMLLELGMIPEVATAVSSVMVLLNSASSVVQFVILGRIDGGYGAVLVCIGLCGSLLGMRVIGYIVDKYDKSSVIVLVLVVALAASVVLVTVEGGLQIAQNVRIGNSAAFDFNPLCTQVL